MMQRLHRLPAPCAWLRILGFWLVCTWFKRIRVVALGPARAPGLVPTRWNAFGTCLKQAGVCARWSCWQAMWLSTGLAWWDFRFRAKDAVTLIQLIFIANEFVLPFMRLFWRDSISTSMRDDVLNLTTIYVLQLWVCAPTPVDPLRKEWAINYLTWSRGLNTQRPVLLPQI